MRRSKIAGQIIADYNKEKEYREWVQRQKEKREEELKETNKGKVV